MYSQTASAMICLNTFCGCLMDSQYFVENQTIILGSPSQPIGYGDAENLLKRMGGDLVRNPIDWISALAQLSTPTPKYLGSQIMRRCT